MFISYNPNPHGKRVGDCVIRAISKVIEKDWREVFIVLCLQGLLVSDLPSSNHVWGAYLKSQGFRRSLVSDECPECYTVEDFCRDNPEGIYVLGTGSHAIAVIDGDYYDAWDSGREQPMYYYRKDD